MHRLTIILLLFLFMSCSRTTVDRLGYELKFTDFHQEQSAVKIAKYEVTNKHFRKFLTDSKKVEFRIDSLRWQTSLPEKNLKVYTKTYHWHPAFDHYPVVNITYEAAEDFCTWLTQQYRLNKPKQLISFRLPTEAEMDQLIAARKHLLISDVAEDYQCNFIANLKYRNPDDQAENHSADGGPLTLKVSTFKQEGLYAILGNVSEICQGNKVKGGNWDTFPSELEEEVTYPLPDPRVGFRVVMEIGVIDTD